MMVKVAVVNCILNVGVFLEEGILVYSGLVVIEGRSEGFLDLCEAVEFVGDELF